MANGQAELLAGVSEDAAREVLALATRVSLPAGAALFRLGEDADRLFLIDRGRILLTLPMKVGGHDEDILVEERVPGEIVGWSALVPPHRFTLKATAPLATDVLAFPRVALFDYFATRPEVGYAVTRNVAAAIGQRLHVFQAMWLREMQRLVEMRTV